MLKQGFIGKQQEINKARKYMKYSAKQITKAGVILTTSKDADAVAEAIKIINDWRVPHFTVIEILMKELKNLLLGFVESYIGKLVYLLPVFSKTCNLLCLPLGP